jgi:hypothetical protein
MRPNDGRQIGFGGLDPLNATEERIPMMGGERERERERELEIIERPAYTKIHSDLILLPEIWSNFPLSERMLFSLKSFSCRRGTKKQTFVDLLKGLNKQPAEPEASITDGKVVRLTILETSNLVLDPNVLHPFVKVHIVDLEKGTYISKIGNRPAVTNNERITLFSRDSKDFTSSHCDIILPVASNCVDLREMGTARPRWNESNNIFDLTY